LDLHSQKKREKERKKSTVLDLKKEQWNERETLSIIKGRIKLNFLKKT
jgi:hypothetical protein